MSAALTTGAFPGVHLFSVSIPCSYEDYELFEWQKFLKKFPHHDSKCILHQIQVANGPGRLSFMKVKEKEKE